MSRGSSGCLCDGDDCLYSCVQDGEKGYKSRGLPVRVVSFLMVSAGSVDFRQREWDVHIAVPIYNPHKPVTSCNNASQTSPIKESLIGISTVATAM